ncbi:MAG: hypothetical protein QGG36_22995 [Pirellulaceae bacterium]|jgi:hypothetical protein|nr:hypothetical protein [Pirellulaceae bacterium]MDP7018685.1 hypothetical protein [Pirellulaceae bacterium]
MSASLSQRQGERIATWIVVTILIAINLIAGSLVGSVFHHSPAQHLIWALYAGTVLGFAIAQLNLIAIWSALAPGRLLVRLPWSMILLMLMWYALIVGNRAVSRSFSRTEAVQLGLVLVYGWLAAMAPFWIARLVFKWRLQRGGDEEAREQFSIRQLLLGMLILSFVLALGRAVLPAGNELFVSMESEIYLILPILTFANMIIVAPSLWVAFWDFERLIVAVAVWLIHCGVVTAIELGVFAATLGPGMDLEAILVFIALNYAQFFSVFCTMLALRAIGYGFLRGAQQSPAGGSPFEQAVIPETVERSVDHLFAGVDARDVEAGGSDLPLANGE